MAPDALRLSPNGATLEVDSILREPLKLTLGQLHLARVDRGPAKVRGQAGRFPVLRRLSATAVVPREQGIEGWLWTSIAGSALTLVGDEDEAPTGALLFTKPLGSDELKHAMRPEAFEALVARSPLGIPAVPGFLFRVQEPADAETAFRAYGLLAADGPRDPADDAPFAADRQVGRPDGRGARTGSDGQRRAAGLLGSPAE